MLLDQRPRAQGPKSNGTGSPLRTIVTPSDGRALAGRIVTKHFAAFRFDVEDGTLWRGAEQVPLTGKAASLLALFARPRRIVGVEVRDHVGGLARHARPARQRQSPRSGNPSGPWRRSPRIHDSSSQHRGAAIRSLPTCRKHARRARCEPLSEVARADFRQSRTRSWRRWPTRSMPSARRHAASC